MRRPLDTLCLLAAACIAAGVACAEPSTPTPPRSASLPEDAATRISHITQRLAQRDAAPRPAEPQAPAEPKAAAPEQARPLGAPSSTSQRLLGPRSDADPGAGSGWFMSTLVSLGVVIGLILALRWFYARLGGRVIASPSSPVVEVLSRTSVAPRNHVLLLRVGGRVLVVSDAGSGMRTLSEIEEPDEVADLLAAVAAAKTSSITGGFNQLLSRFGRDYESGQEGADDHEARVDATRDAVTGVLSRIKLLTERGGAA